MNTAVAATAGVGECSNPVTLRRTVTNHKTGTRFSTDHAKRCGTRIEAKCPSCSSLYRGDAIQVIRHGLINQATNTPMLFTMLTFTAPGAEIFGATHTRHISKHGRVQRCACRSYHNENDRHLGTPINPNTYDYEAAAKFNANASRLFAVTMQKLSRLHGRKLKFVRVMEYQARGLIHIHALVLGPITQRSLELVVRGGTGLRSKRKIAPATSGGFTWGPECKADVICGDTPGRAIAYLMKVIHYALKDTGSGECRNSHHGSAMADAAEATLDCDGSIYDCRHGSREFVYEVETVDTNTGEVLIEERTGRFQGKKVEHNCRRHRRAITGWGFRGHVLAKSRNWGCTFREVRERRSAWMSKSKPQLPDHLEVTWLRLPLSQPRNSTSGSASP